MPTGKTRDSGWQIGVSRTVAASVPAVWRLLTTPRGLAIWLGAGVELPTVRGGAYVTDTGVRGEVRSYRRNDRIRITWQPADWSHDSTVQVALEDKGDRTVLRFHQERLADATERERQRAHWMSVVDRLQAELEPGEPRAREAAWQK